MQKLAQSITKQTTLLPLVLLALTAVQFASIELILPLDAWLLQEIQKGRSCGLDRIALHLKQYLIFYLLLLGGIAGCALILQRRWGDVFHAAVTVISGAFLCELLKTGLERPRPSALAGALVGNSFPSGHVTAAVLIAGALIFFLSRKHNASLIKWGGSALAILLTVVVVWQRLYLGHHWASDVIGSFLIAGFWLCICLRPPLFLRSPSALSWVSTLLLLTYSIFYIFPQTRLVLPTVRSLESPRVTAVSFGSEAGRETLEGNWIKHTREPVGSISWAGTGIARLKFAVIGGDLPSGAAMLRVVARPFVAAKTDTCFPLEIIVNGEMVQRLLLFRGWREYRLKLVPGSLRPGSNTVEFRIPDRFPVSKVDKKAVAFHLLEIL